MQPSVDDPSTVGEPSFATSWAGGEVERGRGPKRRCFGRDRTKPATLIALPSPERRLPWENQAGACAMSEQTPLGVCHSALCCPDPTTAGEHDPFRADQTGLERDRSHERNLEFQRRLADAFLQ